MLQRKMKCKLIQTDYISKRSEITFRCRLKKKHKRVRERGKERVNVGTQRMFSSDGF